MGFQLSAEEMSGRWERGPQGQLGDEPSTGERASLAPGRSKKGIDVDSIFRRVKKITLNSRDRQ